MTAPTPATITAPVSIKAPKWDPENAHAWFAILDAQFVLSGVTVASTKFYHALAALPPEVVGRLDSVLFTSTSYADLKTAVVKEVERTKPELFHHLLDSVPIGKPSQYVKDMRKTADSLKLTDYEDLLKHRLVSSQPPEIAAVLLGQSGHLSASNLAELADQMLTLRTPRGPTAPHATISAIQPATHRSATTSHHTTSNQHNGKNHYGLTPFRPGQRQVICRAHIFYGQSARNCRPWCRWPSSKPSNQCSNTQQPSRASSPTREQHLN